MAMRTRSMGVLILSVLFAAGLHPGAALSAERLYLEGYCDPLSAGPNDEVQFCVSTNAKEFAIEVARVGAEEEVVWTKSGIPAQPSEMTNTTTTNGT